MVLHGSNYVCGHILTTTQTANADVVNENQTVLLPSVEADTTNENSSSTDLKAVSEK
ncbi:hypothetical protein SAMN05216430_11413 [Limosilactobacillus mucosae]|nr:hypothetical protein SAMN05216430_11413 [Limosilactobacillus mucosae]SEL22493.1 hypothetical protein SAMN05216545_11213 [Limosilactobacillus mucosae]SFK34972.1 hypothetical protein SAMN05216461_11414 [Limosilactobacillus mucosae]